MGGHCVITIGNFDGVHAGHRALVARAAEVGAGLQAPGGVVALVFDPHPLSSISPEGAPESLTPFAEREALLLQAGAAEVHRLSPTPEFLEQSPSAFLDAVMREHRPSAFVEGPDFRFGKNRAGDIETLRALCAPNGVSVEVVEPIAVGLSDNTTVTCSSTVARWLVERGRVRDAWAVLTRPHRLSGEVVRGDRRGRDLGYPTANLRTPNMLPADGVYAASAMMPDGSRRVGALSVGVKPQFGAHARTAEVFLLDTARDGECPNLPGLPEYGWHLMLDLVGWVREQMVFDSLERFLSQLERDCERVRAIVGAALDSPIDAPKASSGAGSAFPSAPSTPETIA